MILSSCISWIHVLYEKLVNPLNPMTESEHLPEDIIAEILIRLPAEHVHQCRAICKQWNSLISTSLFNEMYLKQTTPTLVFQQCTRHRKEVFFTHEWGDMNNTLGKPTTQKICTSDVSSIKYNETPYLSFSCHGLLVFRKSLCAPDYSRFPRNSFTTIFNPITREDITLRHRHRDKICGLFFHPIVREYRVLWQALAKGCIEFKMHSLGGRSYLRGVFEFNVTPRDNIPPVILNEALHWLAAGEIADNRKFSLPSCSQCIIIFHILREEFHVMPHPGDASKCSNKREEHQKMHLFDLEGQLSVCKLSDVVEMWVLEDRKRWTKRYNINQIELDYLNLTRVRVLGMQNGSLILHMLIMGKLLAYHLTEKTIRTLVFEKVNGVPNCIMACLHTNSPVSLRDVQL